MVDIWTWFSRKIQQHSNTVLSQLNPLTVISQTQNQITTKRPWWTSNSSTNSAQGNNLFETQDLFTKESGTIFFHLIQWYPVVTVWKNWILLFYFSVIFLLAGIFTIIFHATGECVQVFIHNMDWKFDIRFVVSSFSTLLPTFNSSTK